MRCESFLHIFPGFADPPIVEKVKMFFTNNESTLYSMQFVVNCEVSSIIPQTETYMFYRPTQGQDFYYYPVQLAVIFKRKTLLEVVYKHMEQEDFARRVLNLKVERKETEGEDPDQSLTEVRGQEESL